MRLRRPVALTLAVGALLAVPGCFGARGVDFSFDPGYRFDQIRRVAIVSPADPAAFAGLSGVLSDCAARSLSGRYRVYYGNGLERLVVAGGVVKSYQILVKSLHAGSPIDAELMRRVGHAIGVDAFFYQAIGSLSQTLESGPSTDTLQVEQDRGYRYGTITRNPSNAVLTLVRLGAKLYDAATGMAVWSASKEVTTTSDIADSGFGWIFRQIDDAFVATIPAAPPAGARAS